MNFVKWLPFALLLGCGRTPAPEVKEAAPARVRIASVETTILTNEFEAAGTVTARTTAAVSARLAGHIRELRAREGDSVAAGQVIAIVDGREISTALAQAEAARAEAAAAIPEADAAVQAARAQLDLANVSFGRMETLKQSRSITDQEFDVTQAQARAAQAQLDMAQARRRQAGERVRQATAAVDRAQLQKGDTSVTAPFAGIVTEQRTDAGAFVSPGQAILMLERAGEWRLDVATDESLLGRFRRGTVVRVTLDAIGEEWSLPVTGILPVVDSAARTATVRIALPGKAGIRSGLSGKIRFAAGERNAVVVSARAVARHGQLQRVFTADGGRARWQLVTLGTFRDGRYEVVSGLAAGDRVVLDPPPDLIDGARIEVTP